MTTEETEAKQSQVVVLILTVKDDPVPKVVVFGGENRLDKLKRHLVDLVIKNINVFDKKHQHTLLQMSQHDHLDNFIRLWRHLTQTGDCSLNLEAQWDPEPQVVL